MIGTKLLLAVLDAQNNTGGIPSQIFSVDGMCFPERLQNLKVVSRAKVTENRVYNAAYHPEKTKDIVFFGGEYLASPKLHAMCGESIDVVAM